MKWVRSSGGISMEMDEWKGEPYHTIPYPDMDCALRISYITSIFCAIILVYVLIWGGASEMWRPMLPAINELRLIGIYG
jgi:hypothetical protein